VYLDTNESEHRSAMFYVNKRPVYGFENALAKAREIAAETGQRVWVGDVCFVDKFGCIHEP